MLCEYGSATLIETTNQIYLHGERIIFQYKSDINVENVNAMKDDIDKS